MAEKTVLVLVLALVALVFADQAFVGLNDNKTNLVLQPPAGGQVLVDGVAFRSLLERVTHLEEAYIAHQAEILALQQQVEVLSNSTSTGTGAETLFWAHTNPNTCGLFSPTTVPVAVHVTAGGGGGGGGQGIGANGSPGGDTTVTLVVNGADAGTLMTAAGGIAGRYGQNSIGRIQAGGSSSVDGAAILPGGGGAGGDPGVEGFNSAFTGTAGGGGGFVAGLVTLMAGYQLRACVGQGGQGGGDSGSSHRGAVGADGFVIITV